MVTESFADTLEFFIGVWGAGRATAGSHTIDTCNFPTLPGQSGPVQFTPADVGCPIGIVGAGAVDPFMPVIYNVQGATLRAVITAYNSPTSVEISVAAVTSYYNSGFNNVVVFRAAGMQLDTVAYASSINQGTRDALSFTILRTDPWFVRAQVLLEGQPVYLRSTDTAVGDVLGGLIDAAIVTNQPQSGGGGLNAPQAAASTQPFAYVCHCASWDSIPSRRRVHAEDAMIITGPVDEVVRKLQCVTLIDEGCAVLAVTGGPVITLPVPAGAVIQDLLDKACQLAAQADGETWYWKYDAWRNIILAKRTTTAAPWDVNDSDGSDENVLVSVSAAGTHDQMANTVFSLGSQVLVGTVRTTFGGDGGRTFPVAANIGKEPIITLDTGSGPVSQTVGILGVETGKDFYWNQGSNVVTQDSAGTIVAPADVLLVVWQPLVPALAVAFNNGSLQARAIVEGPGFAYEASVSTSDPITPTDLLRRGQQVATQTGDVPKTVTATTLRSGLKTGMLQHIRLADTAVNDDFLITGVKMASDGNMLYWDYEARNGNGTLNWGATFTQFINRDAPTIGLVTPSAPIVSADNRITIDHTKVAGGADLTNFVFCFRGTYAFLATQDNGGNVFHADGADIFFSSDEAGADLLDFDMDTWDPVTGACVFWVRIPTLSHTADTVLYVQAGDATIVVSRADPPSVWSSLPEVSGTPNNNFRSVLHFGEAAAPYADSTAYHHNSISGSATTRVAGLFGFAQAFGGADTVAIDQPLAGNGFGNAKASISCWLKKSIPSADDEGAISDVDGVSHHGIVLGVKATTGFAFGGSSDSGFIVSAVNVADGNWHHIFIVTDPAGTFHLYVDGAATGSGAALSTDFGGTYPAQIAAADGTGPWVNLVATLDEIHFTQAARTAGWVGTEYANQHSPTTFYTVGLVGGPVVNQNGNPTGTVTHTAGALTVDLPVLGNGGADVKVGVAGQLVPAGGTTGQALVKLSGVDYDTGFGDPAPAPVHDEPLTDGNSNFIFAAGDIVVCVGIPN